MENEVVQIALTQEEGAMLRMSLALFTTMITSGIEDWKNKKDTSMDKLFFMLDTSMEAGLLWKKLALAMGISEEAIKEHLEEGE